MSARSIWPPASRLLLLALLSSCGPQVPVFDGPSYRRDPPQVSSLKGRIVTSNNGDDTLSLLDPAAIRPAERLIVGFNPVELEGPHHLSVDREGRFVYVNLSMAVAGMGTGPHGAHGAATIPGHVVKLDAATARMVASVQVDANPGDNTLTADGKTLYVTHYDVARWMKAEASDLRKGDADLVLVDTATMVVKDRIPLCAAAHGVRLSADERTLYSTCGPDQIAVVDLPTRTVQRISLSGAPESPGATCLLCPYALAVAPDGVVWVSNTGANNGSVGRGSIMIYDPKLPGIDKTRTVQLRGSPIFAAFSGTADNYRAYVPEQSSTDNFVRAYQPRGAGQPPMELDPISLTTSQCLLAHMLYLTPDGKRGYLVCEGNHRSAGSFAWLDMEGHAVMGSVPIGVFPDGLAFVPAAP
jgi:DNA-binding beta-propeller fold protein YncE